MLTAGCHPNIRVHFDLMLDPDYSLVNMSPICLDKWNDIDLNQTIFMEQSKTDHIKLPDDLRQKIITTKISEFIIKKWETRYDQFKGLTGDVYLVQVK